MHADLFGSALERDLADGLVPVAVMASVGTANTGAIDPIDAIADICAEHEVWLHVDGSYGGPAVLLVDGYAPTKAALARVYSLAMDPHKWLYVPVDAGLVLIRDDELARDAFSLVPPYLRTDGDPDGVNGPVWFSEYGFDQTRPFRALKVWLMLKHLGLDGYRDLIAHDIAVAGRLAPRGSPAPDDLELLAHGLSVVCFRCRPSDVEGLALDELNRRVLSAVQLGGSGVSRRYHGGRSLRAAGVHRESCQQRSRRRCPGRRGDRSPSPDRRRRDPMTGPPTAREGQWGGRVFPTRFLWTCHGGSAPRYECQIHGP